MNKLTAKDFKNVRLGVIEMTLNQRAACEVFPLPRLDGAGVEIVFSCSLKDINVYERDLLHKVFPSDLSGEPYIEFSDILQQHDLEELSLSAGNIKGIQAKQRVLYIDDIVGTLQDMHSFYCEPIKDVKKPPSTTREQDLSIDALDNIRKNNKPIPSDAFDGPPSVKTNALVAKAFSLLEKQNSVQLESSAPQASSTHSQKQKRPLNSGHEIDIHV